MKIGRNDPCPCGSGKKYKRCHCGTTDSVVPENAACPISDEDDLELGLEGLNPAKADVMSPEYWDKMSKFLPPETRKELGPLIAQVRQYAEMESRWPQVAAAEEALEAHRAEYEKLTEHPSEFILRAEKLFAEEPFADMRFRAADIQRAFESVGFPTIQLTDKKFAAKVEKAIRFLLDDEQRKRLAHRLLCILPDYVAAGRYLDGWMIWHSADVIVETRRGAVGPFLLAMFMQGLREWELQRDQDQLAMFKEVGLSLDEIRKMGYDGVEAWMRDLMSKPETTAALERFFEARPQLRAMSQEQCHASEEDSIRLLKRREARVLLLTPAEVEPWLKVLEQRFSELPRELTSRLESQSQPSRKDRNTLADVVYSVAAEMAHAVCTPTRLDLLESQLHELRRGLASEGDENALFGIHGALIAVRSETAAEENPFLVSLCWMSLRTRMYAQDESSDRS